MSEALDALAGGDRPVVPRAAFVAALRQQLLAALDESPDRDDLSEPPASDTTQRSVPMPATTTITTSITPYLIVTGGSDAIDFYGRAFGAVVTLRVDQPDGRIGHAAVNIDGAEFSLADEFPEMDILSPMSLGGTTTTMTLIVPDADAVVDRAVGAGATVLRPVTDEFYGARAGTIIDPFGHRWTVTTPNEQLSEDEIQRRLDALPDESPVDDA